MMHPRHVLVDLPKDRRAEVYCFRLPAKAERDAFYFLGKSKLCSWKNAYRRCGIFWRGKSSCTGVEVDCRKLVTDLGRPRFDVVETVVTHGRGAPLISRSPRPFLLPETSTEFQSHKGLSIICVARLSRVLHRGDSEQGAGTRLGIVAG